MHYYATFPIQCQQHEDCIVCQASLHFSNFPLHMCNPFVINKGRKAIAQQKDFVLLFSQNMLSPLLLQPANSSQVTCQSIAPFFKHRGTKESKKGPGKQTVIEIGKNQAIVYALPFRTEFQNLVRLKYMPDMFACMSMCLCWGWNTGSTLPVTHFLLRFLECFHPTQQSHLHQDRIAGRKQPSLGTLSSPTFKMAITDPWVLSSPLLMCTKSMC